MDRLPVEVLRMILKEACPESVRSLRLVLPVLADLGYDYLLPTSFNVVPRLNDLATLHKIANHDRLRHCIQSITFFLSSTAETDGHGSKCERSPPPWPPLHATDPAALSADLRRLSRLRHLRVSFVSNVAAGHAAFRSASRSPHSAGGSQPLDYAVACKSLNVLIMALQQAAAPESCAESITSEPPCRLTSLVVDRMPLELFRHPSNRRLWFQSGEAFSALERLILVIDWTNTVLPASMFKAVNGLGYVLRLAPHLTHLSLAFRNYRNPMDKFMLSFRELLGDVDGGRGPRQDRGRLGIIGGGGGGGGVGGRPRGVSQSPTSVSTCQVARGCGSGADDADHRFRFAVLTDLKIGNVACDELDLRLFLQRHAASLERLRLGSSSTCIEQHGRHLPSPSTPPATMDPSPSLAAWTNSVASAAALATTSVATSVATSPAGSPVASTPATSPSQPLSPAATTVAKPPAALHSVMYIKSPWNGGIRLFNGTFRSLFRGLRGGRLPHLKRLHLEGDFTCELLTPLDLDPPAPPLGLADDADSWSTDTSGVHGPHGPNGSNAPNGPAGLNGLNSPALQADRTWSESYSFRPTTHDDWTSYDNDSYWHSRLSLSSEPFEEYVLGQTDQYPGMFER